MASGMSNFKIKKSFVWKYGLSKLQKKKGADDAEGDPRTPEDGDDAMEPDLDLQPQWDPLLSAAADDPEVPAKRRGGPLVPSIHAPGDTRQLDPAVSQYIRVVAQMQGYDVAGCRSVLRDAVVPFPKPNATGSPSENPIYETLGDFALGEDAGIGEDQQTLYENDDTDDELSDAPIYENSALYAKCSEEDQPIYANDCGPQGDLEETDEPPIYANLDVEEPRPALPPKPGTAEKEAGLQNKFERLEVEVRSDHGYDSYQSPASDSSSSPPKMSPNSEASSPSEGGDGGATTAQVAAEAAEKSPDVANTQRMIPPPPPLPTTATSAEKASNNPTNSMSSVLGPAEEKSKMEIPGKSDERTDIDSLPAAKSGHRLVKDVETKLPPSFVAQLHDMLQKKSHGPHPWNDKDKTVPTTSEKKRSKTGDSMAFQMARKAVAQALQKGRSQEALDSQKTKLTSSLSVPSAKRDVTQPVERVIVTPGVIPPPPPLPGQGSVPSNSAPAAETTASTDAAGHNGAVASPKAAQTGHHKVITPKSLQADLKKKLEAKISSMQADKNGPKKKRVPPKTPDRSFSLPGFGNSRLDIAKAFEEFKRNEEIKKQDAIMKKKKSKYVDKLDLKDYKKSSNTSVEEEMFAIAAESADAMKSEIGQRPPMKSFMSDDGSTTNKGKTSDSRSTGSAAIQSPCESALTEKVTDDKMHAPEQESWGEQTKADHSLPAHKLSEMTNFAESEEENIPGQNIVSETPSENYRRNAAEISPIIASDQDPSSALSAQPPVTESSQTLPSSESSEMSPKSASPERSHAGTGPECAPALEPSGRSPHADLSESEALCRTVSDRVEPTASSGAETRSFTAELTVSSPVITPSESFATPEPTMVSLASKLHVHYPSYEVPVCSTVSEPATQSTSEVPSQDESTENDGQLKTRDTNLNSTTVSEEKDLTAERERVQSVGREMFECVREERAGALPPKPKPPVKKPVVLRRAAQLAATAPPEEHVNMVTMMPTTAVDCEVTVGGSQVIQICMDDTWPVGEQSSAPSRSRGDMISLNVSAPPVTTEAIELNGQTATLSVDISVKAGEQKLDTNTEYDRNEKVVGSVLNPASDISFDIASEADKIQVIKQTSAAEDCQAHCDMSEDNSTKPVTKTEADQECNLHTPAAVITAASAESAPAEPVVSDPRPHAVHDAAPLPHQTSPTTEPSTCDTAARDDADDARLGDRLSDATADNRGENDETPQTAGSQEVLQTAEKLESHFVGEEEVTVEIEDIVTVPGDGTVSEEIDEVQNVADISEGTGEDIVSVEETNAAPESHSDNGDINHDSVSVEPVVENSEPQESGETQLADSNNPVSAATALDNYDCILEKNTSGVSERTEEAIDPVVTGKSEVEAPVEQSEDVVYANVHISDNTIKQAASSNEETDATETPQIPEVCTPSKSSVEISPSVEVIVTPPEEEVKVDESSDSTVHTTMASVSEAGLFRASVAELHSAPSSLEGDKDTGHVTQDAVPAADYKESRSHWPGDQEDDIEAQVAALRSKVMSVNNISLGIPIPSPINQHSMAEVHISACPTAPAEADSGASNQTLTVCEVERKFEELENEQSAVLVAEDSSLQGVAEPETTITPEEETSAGQEMDVPDQEVAAAPVVLSLQQGAPPTLSDSPPADTSVDHLSIIENKSQTKHFLEARLQEGLGAPSPVSEGEAVQPASPEAELIPHITTPDVSDVSADLAVSDDVSKMATQEAISPPPGFDDAPAAEPAEEGVEFEEFDMGWEPRRPAPPPVRCYMFGEQPGHRPSPAPTPPSYRDMFAPSEEPEDSVSAEALSLEERQDSACGTTTPSEPADDELADVEDISDISNGAETMIAQEIRELRRREEELRQLRQRTLSSQQLRQKVLDGQDVSADSGQQAPEKAGTTQEESLSGYGSEERESFSDELPGPVRGLSCEPPRPMSHQRSRSEDSLSSGHSSSGLGSGGSGGGPETGAELLARRRITVKPFEETDDDERWSFPRSAETPIEREIRLAKEREDERRREQAMFSSKVAMANVFSDKPAQRPKASPSIPASSSDPREAALRLATGRVQDEIQEATRREIELRDEGKDITTSEETVDEKVTRLEDMTKHSVELINDKKQRASHSQEAADRESPSRPAVLRPQPSLPRPAATQRTEPAPRPVFKPVVVGGAAGRGMMQKFISSRGKLRPAGAFSPPALRETSPPPRPRRGPALSLAPVSRPELASITTERRPAVQVPSRRVLSAEAKIQLELQAMKEREEELRRHRTRMLAKSQPDLLAALGGAETTEEADQPAPATLCRTRSNPNLLDDQPTEATTTSANRRRRSTLIDQWESRIQGAEV